MNIALKTVLCLMYNALIAALGAQVAIHSGFWWVFPISGILMLRPHFGYRHYQICDCCGAKSPYAWSTEESRAAAANAGWKRVPIKLGGKVSWNDYCPECQMLAGLKGEEE